MPIPPHHKFPEDSVNRDYYLFEAFPDGSAIWRGCVFGMENVESELQELASGSTNKFFALYLQDLTQYTFLPFRSTKLPRAS